jgi:hypothetical protein
MEITPMFIIALINLFLIIIVGCFNFFSHNKIVGNELHHINTDVKSLLSRQEVISEKVALLSTDLAYVKGKCDQNICKKSKKILNKA